VAFEVLQQKLHDLLEVKVGSIIEDLFSFVVLDLEDIPIFLLDIVIFV
jgi:hypothetical protein